MRSYILMAGIFLFAITSLRAQPANLVLRRSEQGLYLDHKVAPKEGLYAIGRLYNLHPKTIAAFNNIDMFAGLAIGQVVRIPLTDTNFSQSSISGTPVYHVVGNNEGLLKISNASNKVALQKLRDWNGLSGDNLSPGSRLIVGFLVSKEMAAQAINSSVKGQTVKQQETPVTKTEPEKEPAEKLVSAEDHAVKTNDADAGAITTKQVSSNETYKQASSVSEKYEPSGTGSLSASDQGYFKTSFDQQVKAVPARKNATVTSGIFKTSSGWQDAKYYLLIDDVATGTIIKLVNPANNKAVYAKVLGEMKGIRQNEGLDIRISNAAASSLGVADTDKFILTVNY